MKIAVVTANLGNFDTPVDPVEQNLPSGVKMAFYRLTDENFPPIAGLTPRLQYRIPKMFGWEMLKGYDVYLWFDSSMSLQHPDSIKWFIEQLGNDDIALFKHPWRKTIKEEVDHIEQKLQEDNKYIVSRYKNGLHKEFYKHINTDQKYPDVRLYASTAFIYHNNERIQRMMMNWWYLQSRYFTCDQPSLTYITWDSPVKVRTISENIFKNPYVSRVSNHK